MIAFSQCNSLLIISCLQKKAALQQDHCNSIFILIKSHFYFPFNKCMVGLVGRNSMGKQRYLFQFLWPMSSLINIPSYLFVRQTIKMIWNPNFFSYWKWAHYRTMFLAFNSYMLFSRELQNKTSFHQWQYYPYIEPHRHVGWQLTRYRFV